MSSPGKSAPPPRDEKIRFGDPSSLYVRLFGLYVRRFLRRHFHGVRLAARSMPPADNPGPIVIYLNHPSWWDPLLALTVGQRFFRDRQHVALIEAAMAERYGILRPLGLIGIEPGTAAGARRFLSIAETVLSRSDTVLWITPQGRFVDPRDRSTGFARGLAHLARRHPQATFLPLAIEYPFWDERTPEALLRFGPALRFGPDDRWHVERELERALEVTQDALAKAAQRRLADPFVSLLDGEAGVGGPYDLWRRVRAWLKGAQFVARHGAQSTPGDQDLAPVPLPAPSLPSPSRHRRPRGPRL